VTAAARISFSLATAGTHAACLASDGGSPLALERWLFAGPAVKRLRLPTDRDESTYAQVLCVSDGRVLITRPDADAHKIVLVAPEAAGLAERSSVTIEYKAVRLIDTPDPETLALAVGHDLGGHTKIWRLRAQADDLYVEPAAEFDGTIGTHCWLDTTGHRIAFNHRENGPFRPTELDLRSGTLRPVPGTSSGQHLLLSSPRGRVLLLAEPAEGQFRLSHMKIDSHEPARFATAADHIDGTAAPIAMSPSGEHVAIRVDRGARSHLLIYTLRQDRVREVEIPPGVIHGPAIWSRHGLRFTFSTPTQPTAIATVTDPTQARQARSAWHLITGGSTRRSSTFDARICEFDGPDGTIEAVVYGNDDWRHSPNLLMALHGGPEAANRMTFDLFFHRLADAGVSIVAPNYRGSTGYRQAHQRALHGAWGGPDLADVRHMARDLIRQRRTSGQGPLKVYGSSYGAFLALLAATADPEYWSHCVAVAPFISGPCLYETGSPRVRELIDRLDGHTEIHDSLGPRDLRQLISRAEAKLMIVHGGDDEIIPVSQSRMLRDRLRAIGRREPEDFTYLEVPHGSHNIGAGAESGEFARSVTQFLLNAV